VIDAPGVDDRRQDDGTEVVEYEFDGANVSRVG